MQRRQSRLTWLLLAQAHLALALAPAGGLRLRPSAARTAGLSPALSLAGTGCRAAACMGGAVAARPWLRPRRAARAAAPAAATGASADAAPPAPPRLPLKYITLALLVLQNSVTAILARNSRLPRVDGGALYLGSVAVFAAEVMKLPVCLALIARDTGGIRPMLKQLDEQVVKGWRDTLRMAVPAACYCVQNLLFFVALSHLTATNYQLWSQSKTLFTALFFVTYLGRTLTPQQWLALLLLSAGVGLVQFHEAAAAAGAAAGAVAAAPGLVVVGVSAVLASSLLSGFANVYFEKVIKGLPSASPPRRRMIKGAAVTGEPVTIWVRNVQLGVFSLPQAAFLMLGDRALISKAGALVGFDSLVWSVVALKALGGLLVAAVVKYADNVLKTYATAIAIVLTCAVTAVSSRTAPTLGFLQGMALVIASIFMYNFSKPPEPKAEPEPEPEPEGE